MLLCLLRPRPGATLRPRPGARLRPRPADGLVLSHRRPRVARLLPACSGVLEQVRHLMEVPLENEASGAHRAGTSAPRSRVKTRTHHQAVVCIFRGTITITHQAKAMLKLASAIRQRGSQECKALPASAWL